MDKKNITILELEPDKVLEYSEGFYKCEYNGKVILADTLSGKNFKMTSECCDIIERMVDEKLTPAQLLKMFQDDSDREFFEKMLKVLVKYRILVTSENKNTKFNVSIEITDRCNLKCRHCCVDAKCSNVSDELTTEQWKSVIDKLKDIELGSLTFTGGEPLIRNDFFEIAEYAKENLSCGLVLMSNATLINEQNADRLLSIFDSFSFSIDGVDEETCAAIRGKGVFDKIIKGIDIMKRKGMKDFSVSMTEVKPNMYCIDRFRKLAKDMGADPIIRNYDIVGRAEENLDLIPRDPDSGFAPILPPFPNGINFPANDMPHCVSCGAMKKKIAIAHNGVMYPCISMLRPAFALGNVMNVASLKQFIFGGGIEETDGYRNFNGMSTIYSNSECRECPVRLFCHTCMQYSYAMKNHQKFEQFCDAKKRKLMTVWN